MNTTKRMLQKVAMGALGLVLGACAQSPLDAHRAKYDATVAPILQNYTRAVTQAQTGTRGIKRGILAGVGFEAGQVGTLYGGVQIRQEMQVDVSECVMAVDGVPETTQTYDYVMSTLARCLDRMSNYRNPLMSFGYRNMGNQNKYYWGYLTNWRRPGGYDSFSREDFDGLDGPNKGRFWIP